MERPYDIPGTGAVRAKTANATRTISEKRNMAMNLLVSSKCVQKFGAKKAMYSSCILERNKDN